MKDWTIMVYMAGDNNLSADVAYALDDIQQVAKASNQKINLMTYCDTSALGAPTFYCDFTNFQNPVWQESFTIPKTFQKKRKKGAKLDESQFRDENSAAIYSILNFVDWCVNKAEWKENGVTRYGRRAKRYALIFSGHSTAFQNMSFLVDTNSDYYMTIPKLRWGLEEITREDGVLLKQPIDLLGFDCCVMGMLELGFGFKDYARTMVASEGNIPNAGWTYGNILTNLICGCSHRNETEIAEKFVTSFINQQNKYAIGGISVDMAAWDLSAVDAVVNATDALAKRFNRILDNPASRNYANLKNALFNSHWKCQSYMYEQNVDLKDFCQLLSGEIKVFDAADRTGLLNLCQAVMDAIDRCILMCGFSGGSYQFSNGISLFFPWTSLAFNTFRDNYESLTVFRKKRLKNWLNFLDKFLNELTIRQPRQQYAEVLAYEDQTANGYYPAKNNHLINEKNNHLINEKNNHLLNEKNNHLINEKNNHLLNEKNNHLINEKNNHLLNEKGALLMMMMAQFKNAESPWYISGFTKPMSVERDYENEKV